MYYCAEHQCYQMFYMMTDRRALSGNATQAFELTPEKATAGVLSSSESLVQTVLNKLHCKFYLKEQ